MSEPQSRPDPAPRPEERTQPLHVHVPLESRPPRVQEPTMFLDTRPGLEPTQIMAVPTDLPAPAEGGASGAPAAPAVEPTLVHPVPASPAPEPAQAPVNPLATQVFPSSVPAPDPVVPPITVAPTGTQPMSVAAAALQNLEPLPPTNATRAMPVLPPPPAPRARIWPWFVGGMVLMGLLTGGIVALAFRPKSSPRPHPATSAPAAPAAPASVPVELKSYLDRAQAGDTKAMRMLGAFYTYGLNVPANREEGLRWYRKAAEAGDETARKELQQLEGTH